MNKIRFWLSIFMLFSLLLAACRVLPDTGDATPTLPVVPTATSPLATSTAVATLPPTSPPATSPAATEPVATGTATTAPETPSPEPTVTGVSPATGTATGAPATQTPGGATSTPGAPAATATPTTTQGGANLPLRLSTLLGETVVDEEDDDLGQVADLVFDGAGRLLYLVMSLDNEFVPLPIDAFERDDGELIFTLSPSLLEDAPSGTSIEQLDELNLTWENDVIEYWEDEVDVPSATGGAAGRPVLFFRTRHTLVVDEDGDPVGDEIEDILLRGGNTYVLLDVDQRFVPVPWRRFEWNVETEDLVLDVDSDVLDDAPGFTSLNQISQNWDDDIDSYWREN